MPDNTEPVHVNVPLSILGPVRLILTDPKNGRIKYGSMGRLVTSLLSNWLESVRSGETSRDGQVIRLSHELAREFGGDETTRQKEINFILNKLQQTG